MANTSGNKSAAKNKKRSLVPEESTQTSVTPKRNKGAICPICSSVVKETQQAIFCEGICKQWMHRQCASLTVDAYTKASESPQPFCCLHCTVSSQKHEIDLLKDQVKNLSSKIDLLLPNATSTSDNRSLPALDTTSKYKSPNTNPSQHPVTQSPSDRKFNLVIHGIAELPSGISRHERTIQDTENVTNILEKITPSFSGSALRDCHRLGRFTKNQTRPRPILAKLNRAVDVTNILSNRPNYPTNVNIKPDLSPEDRTCESKLLAERWRLIQSGIDKRSIKIRRPSIYVNGKLHGKVHNSVFINADQVSMETEEAINSVRCPPSNASTDSPSVTTGGNTA